LAFQVAAEAIMALVTELAGRERPLMTARLVVVSEVPFALLKERRPERERLVPVAFEKVRLV
jgi:hypothetical protein